MRVLPSSPRRRRRVLWLGIGFGIAAAIAGVALLVPNPKAQNTAPPKNAPPAQLATHGTSVSPADRRAINATLDQFIPAALDRRSPATAWRLAGPGLKGGSTLRQWRHGTSPIPYYPAGGKRFHGWRTIDSGPGYVDFSLLVHPLHGSKQSAWVFSGQMVKHGGRWLVNGMYTTAILARPSKSGRHEIGPADFGAGASQSSQAGPPETGGAALGKTWLLVAGGVVLLALLFPLGFGIVSFVRGRRNRRHYERSGSRELPPLPRSAESRSAGAGASVASEPRR